MLVPFQPDDPADPASVMNGSLSWATPPTVPLIVYRQWVPAGVGVGIIWTFPRGLVIGPSSSLVIWQPLGSPGSPELEVNCVVAE